MLAADKVRARAENAAKSENMPWLARLTHPLVFFGAAIAVYEGTIGTALLAGKHSDATVIWLCVMMAIVILAAMGTVAVLVFKRPANLMLTQQNVIGKDWEQVSRVKAATKFLLNTAAPETPAALLDLMDGIEAILSGENA